MRILVTADNAWNYFQSHKKELETELHLIVEDSNSGIDVFITEEDNAPSIVIYRGERELDTPDELKALDKENCAEKIQRLYDSIPEFQKEEELVNNELNDEIPSILEGIDTRERELSELVYSFITSVIDSPAEDYLIEAEIEDCKDKFLEYLANNYDIPIYRPMVVEYENKPDEYLEYPYGNLKISEDHIE